MYSIYISREAETEIQPEAYCDNCGAELSVRRAEETRQSEEKRALAYYVEPCEKCLEAARDEGAKSGYEDGLSDGRNEALRND